MQYVVRIVISGLMLIVPAGETDQPHLLVLPEGPAEDHHILSFLGLQGAHDLDDALGEETFVSAQFGWEDGSKAIRFNEDEDSDRFPSQWSGPKRRSFGRVPSMRKVIGNSGLTVKKKCKSPTEQEDCPRRALIRLEGGELGAHWYVAEGRPGPEARAQTVHLGAIRDRALAEVVVLEMVSNGPRDFKVKAVAEGGEHQKKMAWEIKPSEFRPRKAENRLYYDLWIRYSPRIERGQGLVPREAGAHFKHFFGLFDGMDGQSWTDSDGDPCDGPCPKPGSRFRKLSRVDPKYVDAPFFPNTQVLEDHGLVEEGEGITKVFNPPICIPPRP